jgi:hypothetical protein
MQLFSTEFFSTSLPVIRRGTRNWATHDCRTRGRSDQACSHKAAIRTEARQRGGRARPGNLTLLVLVGLAAIAAGGGLIPTAHGYTPDSPLVMDMVERGLQFLENPPKKDPRQGIGFVGDGEHLMVAYAHYKVRQNPDHPLVQQGLNRALSHAAEAMRSGLPNDVEITYQTSVAILLLIDVDPVKYAKEIQGLGRALIAVQKSHGGFGYLSEELGDISQTQYCVLAMWSMDQADFDVPKAAMDRALRYLLRTQDPTGQWGYKGVDSGVIGNLVPQDEKKGHSLTTAGAGSVLIGGDFFGMWRGSRETTPDIEDFPPALKEQKNLAELKEKRESFKVPAETLMQYIGRSENYFSRVPYQRLAGKSWHYYYLYTLERYRSFLEVARGKQEKEPEWYNEVVDMLAASQGPDGGWATEPRDMSHVSPGISTAFAILFLIRSTKKAIGDLNEGTMAGGYELPKDTTNIRVDGTQIKGKPVVSAVTDLLGLLEGDDPSTMEKGSIPEDLKLADDPDERQKQISRLERLARGSQSWQARRVATRLLGQSDTLDVVPTLIYALTDPDPKVRIFARDGLRFISRKIDGFGMPRDPTPEDIRKAVENWRAWYTSLDPAYVFMEQ